MKRSRFTEEQIIRIYKEHESDVSVADLCRKHGVSGASIDKWKAKFGGMEVSEAKRLKTLEDFDPFKLGQYATIEVANLCAPVVGVQSVILA